MNLQADEHYRHPCSQTNARFTAIITAIINPEPWTPKPRTRNPKNPKPETLNPKPKIRSLKP